VDYRKKKKSTQGKFPAAQTQESHNLTAGGIPPLQIFHGPVGMNHSCKCSVMNIQGEHLISWNRFSLSTMHRMKEKTLFALDPGGRQPMLGTDMGNLT
jgi:hypothetical protein